MSSPGLKRSLPPEDITESSRPRKRPGGASRLTNHDKATARDVLLQRQQEREAEAKKVAAIRGVQDVVRQHYNAVPQRGRDWRKTESRIKGLRSFNNWVKSTIIHKFSSDGSGESGTMIRVLDLGCGKGGDLGKWQQAPETVELYVGIDPAEVSIEQARERYMQMRPRGGRGARGSARPFAAHFVAQDAFGRSIGNIPFLQDVGFDASNSKRGGGFDVVSMMFCMHYAFESEAKTRGMLQNVSSSLKKGGRFIGTIPSSDVIRAKVQAFHRAEKTVQSHASQARLLSDLDDSKLPPSAPAEDTKPEPKPSQNSNSKYISEAESLLFDVKSATSRKAQQVLIEDVQAIVNDDTNFEPLKDTILKFIQEIKRASMQRKKTTSIQKTKITFAQETELAHAQETKAESIQKIATVSEPGPEAETPPIPKEETASSQETGTVSGEKPSPEPAQAKSAASPQKPRQEYIKDSTIVLSPETKSIPAPEIPSVAEWGNSIHRVRFSGPTPKDGMFRPPFGWKYSYFMEEAVEEIPEYVVPWEAFRA